MLNYVTRLGHPTVAFIEPRIWDPFSIIIFISPDFRSNNSLHGGLYVPRFRDTTIQELKRTLALFEAKVEIITGVSGKVQIFEDASLLS